MLGERTLFQKRKKKSRNGHLQKTGSRTSLNVPRGEKKKEKKRKGNDSTRKGVEGGSPLAQPSCRKGETHNYGNPDRVKKKDT